MHDYLPFEQLDEVRSLRGSMQSSLFETGLVLSTGTAPYSAIYTGTCTPPIRTLLHARRSDVPLPGLHVCPLSHSSPFVASSSSHAFIVRARICVPSARQ